MFRAARRRAAKPLAGPLQERLHVGDQAGHRLLVEDWPEAPGDDGCLVRAGRRMAPRPGDDVPRRGRSRGEGGTAPRDLRADHGGWANDHIGPPDTLGVRARTGAGPANNVRGSLSRPATQRQMDVLAAFFTAGGFRCSGLGSIRRSATRAPEMSTTIATLITTASRQKPSAGTGLGPVLGRTLVASAQVRSKIVDTMLAILYIDHVNDF